MSDSAANTSETTALPGELPGAPLPRNARPFLKWVGGKTQLLPELGASVPSTFNRYFEPFLGGGALFFYLRPKAASLSDINRDLVLTYNAVRGDVNRLADSLRHHVYEERYYYQIRDIDRLEEFEKWTELERASRFIFLNKTCFNGLHRVNSSGHFNTPMGRYKNPKILDEKNLLACSAALSGADLRCQSFEAIESEAGEGDFVYFDPPYVPLSKTSSFVGYAHDKFDTQVQQRLYELCTRLHHRRVKFMLSNSSHEWVLHRFKEFNVRLVQASRMINSNAQKRGAIPEVLVTNY